jgi:4-carboxymuconolactone decarboxylase
MPDMIKELFDKGLKIRKEVLGKQYVEKALAAADEFSMPLQDMTTETCWGYFWGGEGLPRRDRSIINLAMISVLNRPHELRTHVKAALRNGLSKKEIGEVFLQVGCYAGIPAAVDSFRIAKEAFAEYEANAQ